MKVIIFYASYGGGHLSAAKSIHAYLDKNYPNKKNGEIVDIEKRGIIVSCGEGSILLLSIKPFGKGIMDASSYVNGVGKDKLIGQVFI